MKIEASNHFEAVVFPGQGSQRRGMALDFCEEYDEAREVFSQASSVLPFDVEALCRQDDPRLDLTEFTQPCILTAEIAIFNTLNARFGLHPRFFGGHSLGEYAALVAAGAIPLEIALRLVHLRGRLMQEAIAAGEGSMVAIILHKAPFSRIREIAADFDVDVANDNSPEQVVLSGMRLDVERVVEELKPLVNGGRVVPLNVSAPFHSHYLASIESNFRKALEAVVNDLDPAKASTVTSNFTGAFHTGSRDDLIAALSRQLTGTVRWRDNMAALKTVADHIVEIGPNRPLRTFFQNIGIDIPAVISVRSAKQLFERSEVCR